MLCHGSVLSALLSGRGPCRLGRRGRHIMQISYGPTKQSLLLEAMRMRKELYHVP